MASLNKVMIIGNLGADPDTRYTPSGKAVTNIRVATNKKWKDRETGEQKEHTEWHSVVFWDKQAETITEHMRKGSAIYLEGELQTRKWQDKQGNDRYTTEIRGYQFQFLDRKEGTRPPHPADSSGATSTSPKAPPMTGEPSAKQSQMDDDFDDDIPF